MSRGVILVLAGVLAAVVGCGKKSRPAHSVEPAVVTSPPPTPDTTPVPALRTPAGLALKPEFSPTPATGPGGGAGAPVSPAAAATPVGSTT